MDYVYDDGGRAAAGFKGDAGDCVCRAVAIVTGKSYREVYEGINKIARKERRRERSSAREGVFKPTTRRYLESIGLKWHPTMSVGTGCRVHLRKEQLPAGRIIVKLSQHVAAVIDGVVHDTFDPSRGGQRCVYGYWTLPEGGIK